MLIALINPHYKEGRRKMIFFINRLFDKASIPYNFYVETKNVAGYETKKVHFLHRKDGDKRCY